MKKYSGWKYYIPEDGATNEYATPIDIYEWQKVHDAEDAATYAAEDEWGNCDGWERGVGDGPVVVVVSPNGDETSFETYREAVVSHTVYPCAKENET